MQQQRQQQQLQQQPYLPMPGMPGMLLPPLAGSRLPQVTPAGLPGAYPAAAGMGAYAPSATGNSQLLGLDLGLDTSGAFSYGAGTLAPAGTNSGSLSAEGHGGDDGVGGGDSRRNKTVRQQEANKVAQQRYRERKKQKFHEMEGQIEALTQQLNALQALQNRNQMLEVRAGGGGRRKLGLGARRADLKGLAD
jgi:hypothetical protein